METTAGPARALVGRDRRAALRPGLPARLPPDRQPPRRRGPHPGGLRPRLPVAVDLHARAPSRAGCTASPPTSSSTRPAASSGSGSTRSPTSAPSASPRPRRRPDLAYVDRTFDDDIERALATLPPDFRAAVVLCDVEGLTYEEIAEILGTKLGTVRSRIHRGRAMLRTALSHRAPGAGRVAVRRTRRRAAALRLGVGPVMGPVGHLGTRVSALLDGQLSPEDTERAWAHVHTCHACRDLVEREGWVKTRLAGLSFGVARRPPTASRARCSARSRPGPRGGAYLAEDRDHRRRQFGLVALGGGAVGAAVMGVLALGVAPADAPTNDRRAPRRRSRTPSPRGPRCRPSRPSPGPRPRGSS